MNCKFTIIALLSMAVSSNGLLGAGELKKPVWTESTPTLPDSFFGIAHTSKSSLSILSDSDSVTSDPIAMPSLFSNKMYKQDARHEAFRQILANFQLSVESQSLFGYLFKNRLYTQSFDDVFLTSMLESERFQMMGEYEEGDDYWCYYAIHKDSVETFLLELEDSLCQVADSIWHEGLAAREKGQLFFAAQSFAQALETVHPMIFKSHVISRDGRSTDMFRAIYDDYISVYTGIEMNTGRTEIPAVAGESVPVEFNLALTRGGRPASGISIQTQYDGELTATPVTDSNGNIRFQIVRAASGDGNNIHFSIDSIPLFDITPTFASSQFAKQTFPSTDIRVNLFNPQILVFIEKEKIDSTVQAMLTEMVGSRQDMSLTANADSADMIISASLNCSVENPQVAKDKYSVSQYSAGMSVTVRMASEDKPLIENRIEDFKIMVTGTTGADKAMNSAARQMCRAMKNDLSDSFSKIKYDKRQTIWSVIQ